MDVMQEYLPLALGIGALALFVVGLALALRTTGGRDALAAAAVRLAVAFLGLAERWLGDQLEPHPLADGVTLHQQSEVTLARVRLTAWMQRRSG